MVGSQLLKCQGSDQVSECAARFIYLLTEASSA